MIDVEEIIATATPEQLAALRYRLETDYFFHAKFFLALRDKQPFIIGRHHALIAHTMQRVINGEIKRLIVNMPPGYTKTELIIIQLVSYCLAFNPGCRFMHISSGDTLPLLNSTYIKRQIEHPLYRKLWGVKLEDDSRAKALWMTNKGGLFYALSSGSQILGFRAGRMKPGFQGALLIDDPQKLLDLLSPVKVKYFPDRYMGEIRHRTANRDTPIIAVMQRLTDEDFCNFLLEGGSGEMWHHLCLPSPIPHIELLKQKDDSFSASKYSHAIPIEHNLAPGPLWPYKHTAEELSDLETSDIYNYSAQYLQEPHRQGGSIFQTEWWKYYKITPDYLWKAIFCDTALKDGEHNDFSVFQCWAYYQGRIYLLDQYRGKVKATDLKQKFIEFWNKHKPASSFSPQPLRGAYIEDKASGTQLIQDIQREGGIPVIGIPRHKSKVERAVNFSPWIRSGLLYLPENAEWLYDYKNEFERFSPLMTHKHDDQIDPTLDAIENMLILGPEYKAEKKSPYSKKPLAPSKNEKRW